MSINNNEELEKNIEDESINNIDMDNNQGEASEMSENPESVPENNVVKEKADSQVDSMEIIDYDIDDKLETYDNQSQSSAKNEKKQKEPFDLKKEIISWVKMLVTAVVLALVITNFIIINATVPTSSMEDTIPAKSRIMGLRLTYLFHDPERLDIIVFKYQFSELEGHENQNYVKRVIGLPGETVVLSNGQISIYDGEEFVTTLDESEYLKESWVSENDGYTFTVPEDCYFVLGDNRNYSADTRYWYDNYYKTGKCKYEDLFIKSDAILGKVYFTYFPSFNFVNQ